LSFLHHYLLYHVQNTLSILVYYSMETVYSCRNHWWHGKASISSLCGYSFILRVRHEHIHNKRVSFIIVALVTMQMLPSFVRSCTFVPNPSPNPIKILTHPRLLFNCCSQGVIHIYDILLTYLYQALPAKVQSLHTAATVIPYLLKKDLIGL
jgi:hypothetical protein